MKLLVQAVINSTNAVQTEDGSKLAAAVQPHLVNTNVEIDFSNIKLAISAFFNGFYNTILSINEISVLERISFVSIRDEDIIVSDYSKRKAILLKKDPEGFNKIMEDLLDESY